MSDFPIIETKRESGNSFQSLIRKFLLKGSTLTGIILLLGISGILAFITVKFGFTAGAVLLAAIIALPTAYFSVAFPKFGMIVLFILASIIFLFIRIGVNFPLGTLIDAFQALLILGFLIKQKNNPNWKIYKNPITTMILIWIGYNILQFINPEAESRLAWVYTIRSVALVMLMYFVFLWNLDSKKFIRLMLKVWIAISFVVALYAVKQEFIGFFPFEERSMDNDLSRALLFINGHWRKASIYSDPVTFSYNMVITALLCFGLCWGPRPVYKKVILGVLCVFFLYVMLFSGTRGAYVLFPAAMILFAILHLNKKVMLFSAAAGLFFAFLIFMPTSNQYLQRFQTAFKPSQDDSYRARQINQERIQPYIQTHPFGGGLGACGVWGQRFAPNSFLANFPPDSGYARVAVELGWIGLILICTLMFVVLKSGINYFFRIKDPELKNYCLCMILVVFALNVGNYPQEALIQFPSSFFFYLAIALINAVYILDKKTEKSKEENKSVKPTRLIY